VQPYPHQPRDLEKPPISFGGSSEQPRPQSRNIIRNSDGWCLERCAILPVPGFDCGDADLNEYFSEDAIEARDLMTCETFSLSHVDSDAVVGLVSVCNDVVEVKHLRTFFQFRETPEAKLQYKQWPAVKIARLAVRSEIQGKSVGTHLMNLLKTLFVQDNRTGCRIMTVDAYNNTRVIRFYERNGFVCLTEKDKLKHTRAMWFDLLPWRNLIEQGGITGNPT
jgi:GNAT superfamily N-acetyltransferase